MKKIKIIILTIISFTISYSCTDLEEINTDPNKSNEVAPGMLATQVLKDTYRFWNVNAADFLSGNVFNKHVVSAYNENPGQYYWSYWPYGSFDSYTRLTDLNYMVKFAEGSTYEPSYRGLALFMKAWYGFQNTLDVGDIPYSEAGLASEGNFTPKYDKQADVFQYILDDLQEAEAYFAQGQTFDGDIMFEGDPLKWQKLCNTLQLKVIQTMSKQATSADIARFAAIVSAGNLMAGNDDNFKLSYSTNANAIFPFYQNGSTFYPVSILSELTVNSLKNLNDRRLFYFADPAPVQITGGLTEDDFNAYVGALSSLPYSTIDVNAGNGEYSTVNNRYTMYQDNDPMLYITYSEQCFMIAEAIEEGWVSGSAQQYYEDGVKAQLEYYMNLPNTAGNVHGMDIDQTYIDNYFTGEAAYKTAGTKEDRLHQIWTQRWLIDFFQGNGGNYPQFLRTGWPVYPLDPATSLNSDNTSVYPKRWLYPTGEQTTNQTNYLNAIQDQYGGNDATDQTPWYLQ